MTRLPALLANVTRSGKIESQHRGHLVIIDGDGKIVIALGDPDYASFMRSAAKPFQAIRSLKMAFPRLSG